MTTPGGLPFPDSLDDLNQGANDIKALALALDARGAGKLVQSGSGTGVAGSNQGSFTIMFPTPFKSAPLVFPMIVQGQSYVLNVISAAAGSCVIGGWYLPNNNWAPSGFQIPYNWLAIGVPL